MQNKFIQNFDKALNSLPKFFDVALLLYNLSEGNYKNFANVYSGRGVDKLLNQEYLNSSVSNYLISLESTQADNHNYQISKIVFDQNIIKTLSSNNIFSDKSYIDNINNLVSRFALIDEEFIEITKIESKDSHCTSNSSEKSIVFEKEDFDKIPYKFTESEPYKDQPIGFPSINTQDAMIFNVSASPELLAKSYYNSIPSEFLRCRSEEEYTGKCDLLADN